MGIREFLNRPIPINTHGYSRKPQKFQAPEGETVIFSKRVEFGRNEGVFAAAVTDQAVYVLKMKNLLFGPLWKFWRFPFAEIRELEIKPISRRFIWSLSFFLLILAILGFIFMIVSDKSPFLVHAALILAAITVPFLMRGKRGLTIRTASGTFYWTPPIAFRGKIARRTDAALGELAEACTASGVRVVGRAASPASRYGPGGTG